MTRVLLTALWSHWRRAPLHLFTLIAGLALSTALWSGVQAINTEARASYDASAAQIGTDRFATLTGPMDQATWVRLRRAGWLTSPLLEGRRDGLRILGIEPLTAPRTAVARATEAEAFTFDTAVIHPADADRAQSWGVPLIQDATLSPGTAIADIGTAQKLLDRPGAVTRLIVLPAQPLIQPPLSDVAPELTLTPPGTDDTAALTDSFHLNLTAFGALSFAVGIFIVHATIGLAFEQRRPLIRTLRALGAPLRVLAGLIVAELLVLALVAGTLGLALGYGIAGVLLPDVSATLRGLYGADVSGSLAFRPFWAIAGLGMAVLGTALAAASSLTALLRAPLLASGQARAWSLRSARSARWQALAAAGLLAIAAALSQADGLTAAFALLAALLIGGALLLPALLALGLTGAAYLSRRPRADWFWADTRQQLPGLSLALMALLLAMATNIGVTTMVSSFRLTFLDFLDQRLASELYVTAESPDAGPATLLPIRSQQITVAGVPTHLHGPIDHATYRDHWRFLTAADRAWDTVFAGKAIAINEQLARRAGLWIGDIVALPGGPTLPIAGVYGDYGNPTGQALIAGHLWEQLYPTHVTTQWGIRTTDPTATRARLIASGVAPADIIDQAALKSQSREIFERTFTVTTALNVLTLAVAGFSILMSLLTLAQMRLPQLAPIWALGLTRARLGQVELLRSVALALATALLAVPLGLALAWVLLAVVNVQAFGWRLPLRLFPGEYLRLIGFAVAAGAVAALWPAWRLSRVSPAKLLGVFANDR